MARGGARRTAALGLVLRLLLGFGLGLEAAPTPVPIPFLAHSPGESSAQPARVPLGGPTPPRAPRRLLAIGCFAGLSRTLPRHVARDSSVP